MEIFGRGRDVKCNMTCEWNRCPLLENGGGILRCKPAPISEKARCNAVFCSRFFNLLPFSRRTDPLKLRRNIYGGNIYGGVAVWNNWRGILGDPGAVVCSVWIVFFIPTNLL